jgi:hypothetical protein
MTDILGVIVEQVIDKAIGGPVVIIAKFAWWFYGTLIPFITL